MTVDPDPSPLNAEQRKLYNIVTAYYIQELSDSPLLQQLLLNVNGLAGVGKTFTLLKTSVQLKALYVLLKDIIGQAGKGNLVVCLALTGITAFNIIRQTLYSLFWLLINKKIADLLTMTLKSLQA